MFHTDERGQKGSTAYGFAVIDDRKFAHGRARVLFHDRDGRVRDNNGDLKRVECSERVFDISVSEQFYRV